MTVPFTFANFPGGPFPAADMDSNWSACAQLNANNIFAPTTGTGVTITPTSPSEIVGLNITQNGFGNVGGQPTHTSQFNYNSINVNTDGAICSPQGVATTGLFTNLTLTGTTYQGTKIAGFFKLLRQGTGNTTVTRGDTIALSAQAVDQTGQGGTDTSQANSRGDIIAMNPLAQAQSGATNLFLVEGAEVDVGILTGASAFGRLGWNIVGAGNLQAASAYDIGLGISTQSIDPGFKMGIMFHKLNGGNPVSSGGTLIGTDANAVTVTSGIDFSTYTITGSAFKTASANLTGAGSLSVGSNGAPPEPLTVTAATDSGVRVTDGTLVNLFLRTSSQLTHSGALGTLSNHPLAFLTNNTLAGSYGTDGSLSACASTAVPAGGTTGAGIKLSTTSNLGIFFGSGTPSLSAAQGSLYLRTDGAQNARLYINTNGSTTWATFNTLT